MEITFNSILSSPTGLRFVFNTMKTSSSFSRQLLLESNMMLSAEQTQHSFDELANFHKFIQSSKKRDEILPKIKVALAHLKDIRNTVSSLSRGGTLDDVEFFEIKNLSLINKRVSELLQNIGSNEGMTLRVASLPDLSNVMMILDPENQGLSSFYIYDCYHPELPGIREKIRGLNLTRGRAESGAESGAGSALTIKAMEIESIVRTELVERLRSYSKEMNDALHTLGELDLFFAKVDLIEQRGFSIPTVGSEKIKFVKMFNPEVEYFLKQRGGEYQRVDVELSSATPLLITGANMGGKSVTLKTLALSQYLFQFGIPVPAESAEMTPVSFVALSLDKQQSIEEGLSSFAVEMLDIDSIVKRIKSDTSILALIDEPASRTNPMEGEALVTALLKVVGKYSKATVVVTTHYNIKEIKCRRMRVKGFAEGSMDYSLIEDTENEPPREALRIAKSLNVDAEWIAEAEKEMGRVG